MMEGAAKNSGRFGKGNPGKPKGAVSKTTKALKEAILEAAELSGRDQKGKDGLVGYLQRVADEDVKAFTEMTGGKLGNVVVDATGSVKSMTAAMNHVGFAGRLVWVGITQDELSFTQPLMHRREMTFLASRNALSAEFTRIIRLIEGGMLDTRPWITHTAPFDGMIGEFTKWLKPETGVVKAMVEVA